MPRSSFYYSETHPKQDKHKEERELFQKIVVIFRVNGDGRQSRAGHAAVIPWLTRNLLCKRCRIKFGMTYFVRMTCHSVPSQYISTRLTSYPFRQGQVLVCLLHSASMKHTSVRLCCLLLPSY